MQHLLNKGKWTRPTDKMAVYLEFEPGRQWGVRVTLYESNALVEAVDGPRCSWYEAPDEVSVYVHPPTFFQRLRGLSFEDKLMGEVEAKRAVARDRNQSLTQREALSQLASEKGREARD